MAGKVDLAFECLCTILIHPRVAVFLRHRFVIDTRELWGDGVILEVRVSGESHGRDSGQEAAE